MKKIKIQDHPQFGRLSLQLKYIANTRHLQDFKLGQSFNPALLQIGSCQLSSRIKSLELKCPLETVEFSAHYQNKVILSGSYMSRKGVYTFLYSKQSRQYRHFTIQFGQISSIIKAKAFSLGLLWPALLSKQANLSNLIGSSTGKVLILEYKESGSFHLQAIKCSQNPIVDIIFAKQNPTFGYQNIAVALDSHFALYLLNIKQLQVVVQFCTGQDPPGHSLNCSFSQSHRYLMSSFVDGHIQIWHINEKLQQRLEQAGKGCRGRRKQVSCLHQMCLGVRIRECLFQAGFLLVLTQAGQLYRLALDLQLDDSYLFINKFNLKDVISKQDLALKGVFEPLHIKLLSQSILVKFRAEDNFVLLIEEGKEGYSAGVLVAPRGLRWIELSKQKTFWSGLDSDKICIYYLS